MLFAFGCKVRRRSASSVQSRRPVSILEMQKWVKGDPAHRAVYDGRTWLFAGARGKQMFEANPAKYVDGDLAYGGKGADILVVTTPIWLGDKSSVCTQTIERMALAVSSHASSVSRESLAVRLAASDRP
jgi:YHS domain-containing protein